MTQPTTIPRPLARAWRGTLWLLATAGLVATLSACSDEADIDAAAGPGAEDKARTTTVAATSLGPVRDAAVVAFAADELDADRPLSEQKDAVLAAAKTDTNGIASGLDLGNYDGRSALITIQPPARSTPTTPSVPRHRPARAAEAATENL